MPRGWMINYNKQARLSQRLNGAAYEAISNKNITEITSLGLGHARLRSYNIYLTCVHEGEM